MMVSFPDAASRALEQCHPSPLQRQWRLKAGPGQKGLVNSGWEEVSVGGWVGASCIDIDHCLLHPSQLRTVMSQR